MKAPAPAELTRVAAEQEWPRLWVWRVCRGRWQWFLIGPDAEMVDSGDGHPTQLEALAVGLAALEEVSARWQV